MGRLLREPLLHFFVLGAGLFALFAWLRGPLADPPERIHVDAMRIEQLAQGFARTWQRPPTQTELASLVDEFVREEIFYREALAMGLDRDDTVVRRRMRQKLEFLSEDIAPIADPDDAALASHHAEHADAYRIEPRIALRQIFVSRDQRGDDAPAHVQALLARLATDPGRDEMGDASLLPASLPLVPLSDVRRTFGDEFAGDVAKLTPGHWSGPVETDFGLHLVFVDAWQEARASTLDEVRDAVRRDWLAVRRAEANEAFYQGLRARYEVKIEDSVGPESTRSSATVGTTR